MFAEEMTTLIVYLNVSFANMRIVILIVTAGYGDKLDFLNNNGTVTVANRCFEIEIDNKTIWKVSITNKSDK
jgi:hypothetical protein